MHEINFISFPLNEAPYYDEEKGSSVVETCITVVEVLVQTCFKFCDGKKVYSLNILIRLFLDYPYPFAGFKPQMWPLTNILSNFAINPCVNA